MVVLYLFQGEKPLNIGLSVAAGAPALCCLGSFSLAQLCLGHPPLHDTHTSVGFYCLKRHTCPFEGGGGWEWRVGVAGRVGRHFAPRSSSLSPYFCPPVGF